MQKKSVVLDTNVLLYDPQSIFSFDHMTVSIPSTVIEEIDSFKKEPSDRGRSARELARILDNLREQGSLHDGVKLPNGGVIKIDFVPEEVRPAIIKKDTADNEILLTAYVKKEQGEDVLFITKDINARIKADVLGFKAEDYVKGRVEEYDMYKGWRTISVPSVQLTKPVPDDLIAMASEDLLTINEFVVAQSTGNQYNYKIFRYLGGNRFKAVENPAMKWPIQPRNLQQLMTLDLLFDPSIEMVSLVGPAGTGKTFLALLAGLHQVLVDDLYSKVLLSRPVIPLGPDIGYLPGDIQEKLRSWMQPMYDNMGIIIHSAQTGRHQEHLDQEYGGGSRKKKKGKHVAKQERMLHQLRSMDDMVASGKISIEAITYMRGRSIPYQFIIIDEVQNLTPHEVKTIITRVGEGSKIVLCGDPYQIDSPYLDFSSNGLILSANAFRGQEVFGTVFLETSERSILSKLASELL